MARCIIILGIHRSGTSATAGIVNTLGISLGPTLIGASSSNAKGHFEDAEIVLLNEQALGVWHMPIPQTSQFASQYKQILHSRAKNNHIFAIKDPRLCLTGRDVISWMQAIDIIDDIRIIAVSRSFTSSVNSMVKRDKFSFERAIQIQSIYQYGMVDTLAHFTGNILHLSFEHMIEDPHETSRTISSFCFDQMQQPDWSSVMEAAQTLDSNLITINTEKIA